MVGILVGIFPSAIPMNVPPILWVCCSLPASGVAWRRVSWNGDESCGRSYVMEVQVGGICGVFDFSWSSMGRVPGLRVTGR